jgi:hypothetical protein
MLCRTSRQAVELEDVLLLLIFFALSLPIGLEILGGRVSSLLASSAWPPTTSLCSPALGANVAVRCACHLLSLRRMNQQWVNLKTLPTRPSYICRAFFTCKPSVVYSTKCTYWSKKKRYNDIVNLPCHPHSFHSVSSFLSQHGNYIIMLYSFGYRTTCAAASSESFQLNSSYCHCNNL